MTIATHEQLVQDLYKLGVAGLPPVNSEDIDQSWGTYSEQLAVLKTIEVMISRRKRIISDAARRSENRVDPLSSQLRGQQVFHDQLTRQSADLDAAIASAQAQLQTTKSLRAEQKLQQGNELKEVDRKILALSRPSSAAAAAK